MKFKRGDKVECNGNRDAKVLGYLGEVSQMKTENVKHTPGPWRNVGSLVVKTHFSNIEKFGKCGECSTEGIAFATCGNFPFYRTEEEQKKVDEANASLLAAAPDLLEACKRALALLEYCRELAVKEPMASSPLITELQTAGGAVLEARAAIYNAEGK